MNTIRAIFIGQDNELGYGHTGDVNPDEYNTVKGVETVLFKPDGRTKRIPVEKNDLYVPD